MVIFGFSLFALRGWRNNWFWAEFPCIVVNAGASKLALFESCFYNRRGNSLQGFLVVFMDRSLNLSLILFLGFLVARLPSLFTILGFVFSFVATILTLSLFVFFLKTSQVFLWRVHLFEHQVFFNCQSNPSHTFHMVNVISRISFGGRQAILEVLWTPIFKQDPPCSAN